VPLAGRPLVRWSIDAFGECESVGTIVVAVPPGQEERLGGEEGGGDTGELRLTVVAGGATRAQSVANALAAVETELVAIHDAARPLVTAELVEALVAELAGAPAAAGIIAASALADTVKRTRPAFPFYTNGNAGLVVEGTEDRTRLWAAQTPQVFRLPELRRALAAASNPAAATDESMLVEAAGGTVLIHPCEAPNLKVTTPLDLRLAELLLSP
jgi:2-C-methyl-D-erythritol 4-phosphate cytidylyltransferase